MERLLAAMEFLRAGEEEEDAMAMAAAAQGRRSSGRRAAGVEVRPWERGELAGGNAMAAGFASCALAATRGRKKAAGG
jgi:hypothetical protein